MLKPAQMTKIDLQMPEEYISRATMVIAQLKSLHLVNVRKSPLGQNDLETNPENIFVNKYKQLNTRLQSLYKSLGISYDIPCCPFIKDFDPFKDIVKLEKDLDEKEADGEHNEIVRVVRRVDKLGEQHGEYQHGFGVRHARGEAQRELPGCRDADSGVC